MGGGGKSGYDLQTLEHSRVISRYDLQQSEHSRGISGYDLQKF